VSKEFHLKNLPLAIEEAFEEGKMKRDSKNLKAIAVTIGPG
jgi:tRNA A37 threonylcarbamoyltransferase TsaD